MKLFLSGDFLLHTKTAKRLSNDLVGLRSIFDYHCHVPLNKFAADRTL